MHPSVHPKGWSRRSAKPFDYVYRTLPDDPVLTKRGKWAPLGDLVPYCAANVSTPRRKLALLQCDSMCPDNRRGKLCEKPKDSFCLRSCSGHGWCDSGFCWCDVGWFGIDCSLHLSERMPRKQEAQATPSPVALAEPALELKVYVYDMPSEFTSQLLQYRGDHIGPHREINKYQAHQFTP